MKELDLLYNIVNEELRQDERCRNDDLYLLWKVWRKFSPVYIPFDDFSKIPPAESITRVRRKIQNTERRYPPTNNEIAMKRGIRQEEFRAWTVKKVMLVG